eukprot:Em0017g108a
MAGISRSVTLVIAYLMQYYRLPMQQAYQFVKDKRPAISPNLNFMGQLVEFDRTIKEHKLTQILDISAYRPTAKQEKAVGEHEPASHSLLKETLAGGGYTIASILRLPHQTPSARPETASFSLSMRMSNHVLLHAWLWTSLIPTGHRLSSAPTRPLLALRTAFISSLAASGFGSPDNIHLQQAVAQFNSQVSQHDTVTAVTVEDVLASPPHQSSLLG